jgi:hypothetical protein
LEIPVCSAIRTLHSQGKIARPWPLGYLIRYTAFHTLDHAWEMEDKDLTGRSNEREKDHLEIQLR